MFTMGKCGWDEPRSQQAKMAVARVSVFLVTAVSENVHREKHWLVRNTEKGRNWG